MTTDSIAVLGSGTMGAGIAQAALAAGLPVTLYDVSAAALERARERIAAGLQKQGHADAITQLQLAATLDAVAGAALVIEAVPERLDLKRDLFAQLGAICPASCVLASNTSSIPIAQIATACPEPQRVAGLHFFNPVHRMALVEVIRTAQTDESSIATLVAFVERIGKTAVLARDTPGFVVNRVARPFYSESLRLLGEQVASHATIDTLLQKAGGFPLGPFALMDLIGIDVNFAVTSSMYEQSFYEPRYRPHQIQQQLVLAGRLGRKTGQGFYAYGEQAAASEQRPAATGTPHIADNGSVLVGGGTWGMNLAELCAAAGLRVIEPRTEQREPAEVSIAPVFEKHVSLQKDVLAAFVIAGQNEGALEQVAGFDRLLPDEVPIFAQCADVTACALAASLRHPERLIGFDGLFLDGAITLVATPLLSERVRAAAETVVQRLGRTPVWISDSPALVVPRVVAMLANEAAFAVGEGVADAATINTALQLGANHPVGPLARAEQIGYSRIVTILDHLRTEYGEERYRVAPLLRRAARIGRLER